MYLHVPPSDHTPTDLSLNFKFGPGSATRSWNIKITFIPCASSYKGSYVTSPFTVLQHSVVLAPDYCLQYITSSSGKINSFNWRDVTPAIRQLANMDYRICFRTETVNNQVFTEYGECYLFKNNSNSVEFRERERCASTSVQ